MRLGIFGGTFDPVHMGHLLLAESCREQCRLDQIHFMPTAVSPHKQNDRSAPATPRASPEERVEMLRLAIGGHPAFTVSTMEIDRGGISYTVDTLAAIAELQPAATLFLLLGADALSDLPTWRDPGRICRLAIPLVARRRGTPLPDLEILAPYVDSERLQLIREHAVETPMIELSSTEIRDRIRAGRSIRFRTTRAVEQYIMSQQLYLQDPPVNGG